MQLMNSFKVRYAETDQMGIVHHSNYPIWFETGRTAYFNTIGMPYSKLEEMGFLLPLIEMSCSFKSPARYDDEVLVVTWITGMTCVKIEFEYEVINNLTNKMYATGKTVHAWTNKALKPFNIIWEKREIFEKLEKSMKNEKECNDNASK